MTAVAGIDVGGTKCLGVLFEGGQIIYSVRRPTPPADEPVASMAELARELRASHAVGVVFPATTTPAVVVREAINLTAS